LFKKAYLKIFDLQEHGVILISVTREKDGKSIETYYLIYRDVIIAEAATETQIQRAIAPFFGKNGVVLLNKLDRFSPVVKISDSSLLKLLNMADTAITFVKKQRPKACAVLEGNGKAIFNYSNKESLPPGVYPSDLHPLVIEWLNITWLKESVLLPLHHGKCAEVMNISEWLKIIDPKLKMAIEDARKEFEGVISYAINIGETQKGQILKHGDYKKACNSCNPLLEYFNITEAK
jgi:hypothetical protein